MEIAIERKTPVKLDVRVTQDRNKQPKFSVRADINGRDVNLSAVTQITNLLKRTSVNDVQSQLDGGYFAFADDHLLDFRFSDYSGFVHTEPGLQKLIELLGLDQSRMNRSTKGLYKKALFKQYSLSELESNTIGEGGLFTSSVGFRWSPFETHLESEIGLTRLVCENGMVVTKSHLKNTIPLVNKWEENLEIANKRLKNKFEEFLVARVDNITESRASVAAVQNINKHAVNRLAGNYDESVRERLLEIARMSDVESNMSDVYKGFVFSDRSKGARVPSDLSTFDAWNFATEMHSHTEEAEGSTQRALTMLSNSLFFDEDDLINQRSYKQMPELSQFSDPDAAFAGAGLVLGEAS